MSLSRRDFLNRSAVAGLVLVGSTEMFTTSAVAAPGGNSREAGYGPLVDDPAGVLALPAGFSYAIVTRAGSTVLESGEPTPGNHDGTGAFPRQGGGTVLVNNHELSGTPPFPVPHLEGLTYDPGTPGGCTIVEADRDGNRVREYVGLAGTSTNCAGGVTPWGTWLSCEETETLAGQSGATKDHGYVFEVDPHDRGQPRSAADQGTGPLRARGRRGGSPARTHLPHRRRRQPERTALPLGTAAELPTREG